MFKCFAVKIWNLTQLRWMRLYLAVQKLGFIFRKIDGAESFHYLKGQLHHSMVVPEGDYIALSSADWSFVLQGQSRPTAGKA